jgi:lipoate-protein ligase A
MRQFADTHAAGVGSLLEKPALWLTSDLERVDEQLALDETMLEEAHEGRLTTPIARTWMAVEPTVVVGSSSRIDDEVDRAACARLGVRILRRPSGGLTVVLGPGCVMWSVIVPLAGPQPPIERIHAALLDPLCEALRISGQPVVRRGSSDLAIETEDGDRKISGNALRIRRGGILYHGTLLDAFDLDLVGTVLRHPPREPDYRGRRAHGAFLANLGIGRAVIDTAVRQAFRAEPAPTTWPRERVDALVRERYASVAWTERRS